MSEFWALMEQEFGSGYAEVVARTQTLRSLGSQTVDQALEAGVPARRVWEAVVRHMDVPPQHHWLPEPPTQE